MIDIGDDIEVVVVRHVGKAANRPDTLIVGGLKIWPNGRVGRFEGLDFRKGDVEFRNDEPLWDLIVRAVGQVKP
jgi:hypothetical protein